MKLGVIHYNFPGYSFTDFLKYAGETGYGYVELGIPDVWGPDTAQPERQAERVRKQVDSFGLRVSALSAGNDFIQLEESAIAQEVDRMGRICGLARLLGAPVIRTEGGRPKESVPQQKWVEAMAGCLERCLEIAETENVSLAVDNHGLVTNDGDLQVELFKRVGSKRVGANLDTMNYRWFGHDLASVRRFYEVVAPYTLHTHMKDGRGSRAEYVGTALGEGEIDLAHAIRYLKEAGYEGVWCSEYEGKEDSAAGYRKCYEYLKANL